MALPLLAVLGRALIPSLGRGAMGGMFGIKVDPRLVQAGLLKLDKDLDKEIGQAHKRVGEFAIRLLNPTGVGEGRGASIRPSATKRDVLLRVGGGHRDVRALQWGQRQVWPGGDAPDRPYIVDQLRRQEREILRIYREELDTAIKSAGF